MNPEKLLTLGFLRRDDEILLAMKKRGFGAGRWNGFGGKVEPGESIEAGLIREAQEEIRVTLTKIEKVAIHTFNLPYEHKEWTTHTYIATEWDGEPSESEEMTPKWFKMADIPYTEMWSDDKYWLPAVLLGDKLRTIFTFDNQDNLLNAQITPVATLDD
jgi:8-oxo-dGTP pyrophosphatase MutT (NUDIX family)